MSSFTTYAKDQPIPSLLNGYGARYFEEACLFMHQYSQNVKLALLDDAFQTGKTVTYYSFGADYSAENSRCVALNYLLREVGSLDPMALREYLLKLDVAPASSHEQVELNKYPDLPARLWLSQKKSVNVFSPFHLGVLKKLPAIPSKWTMTHVRRALANGQFNDLKCVQRLTDDYAYDAASDFQRGPIDAYPMLRELTESPSGWWTQLNGDRVSVCCHSFDSNSFTLRL